MSGFHDYPDTGGYWSWVTRTVTINSTGVHTLGVWGREDGFRVDKIVVSTSATAPTGNGPSESSQGRCDVGRVP